MTHPHKEVAAVQRSQVGEVLEADVVIIGSGMGGAAAAWALRESGHQVLILERGGYLPREEQNWAPGAVFGEGRYKNAEEWYDSSSGQPFQPGVHYWVGGNTKVYGASLPRFRVEDFDELQHEEGISPGWPFTYADIEPFYCLAEELLGVRGSSGTDPTEPWRSTPFPHGPLEHEHAVERLAEAMRGDGLHPFVMPMGVDYGDGGKCVRCRTCDGFPCRVGAKNDAETRAILPALKHPEVTLLTHARVVGLQTDGPGSRIVSADVEVLDRRVSVRGKYFILAAGAANTAALLLRSRSTDRPGGIANSSGLVGRNYMVHNSTFLVALDPLRRNRTMFQKTLGMNDWYLKGPETPFPLGNIQMLGKLQGAMVKPARSLIPSPLLELATQHSLDLYLTTEDLPDPQNRVTVDSGGRVSVRWQPNNLLPHRRLLRQAKAVLRHAGYPLIFHERMGIATNSHMCGTAVMGDDPRTSVLDASGRAHDVENLWITDSSGFVSSAAVNPALTIAANALRVVSGSGLLNGRPVRSAQPATHQP